MTHLTAPAGAAGDALARAGDVEGKIARGIEALGPVSGRDVLIVGSVPGVAPAQVGALGARVRTVPALEAAGDWSAGSVDVIIGGGASFRGVEAEEIRLVDRLLSPGGRQLVVHHYGRDDVVRLRPNGLPEYGAWSRRDGPFLTGGFRVRVLHCFWTFDSLEEASALLENAFGQAGRDLAARLRRPRLSWNVAIYHRTRGERGAGD